jgi:hypothetical protein
MHVGIGGLPDDVRITPDRNRRLRGIAPIPATGMQAVIG